MNYIHWPHKKAIGACYCLDQTPNGERYGGLTVTIGWPSGETGTITIRPTDQRTGDALDDSIVHVFGRAAEKGIRDAARELSVDLDQVDVLISDFAYHPVDSRDSIYEAAARSAFRSAWEAWRRFYVPPPTDAERR